MGKSATLTEVAGRAGVSVITASRALRGEANVAAATRKKVLVAARELDYTPDVLAQTMRGGSSKLMGVFLIGFRSHVHHELLVGIDREANQRGYDLMVFNAANYDTGRTTGVDTMLKLCDGVMWLLPNASHNSWASWNAALCRAYWSTMRVLPICRSSSAPITRAHAAWSII